MLIFRFLFFYFHPLIQVVIEDDIFLGRLVTLNYAGNEKKYIFIICQIKTTYKIGLGELYTTEQQKNTKKKQAATKPLVINFMKSTFFIFIHPLFLLCFNIYFIHTNIKAGGKLNEKKKAQIKIIKKRVEDDMEYTHTKKGQLIWIIQNLFIQSTL